jgi:ubiquitin
MIGFRDGLLCENSSEISGTIKGGRLVYSQATICFSEETVSCCQLGDKRNYDIRREGKHVKKREKTCSYSCRELQCMKNAKKLHFVKLNILLS